jgi:DNA polymerase
MTEPVAQTSGDQIQRELLALVKSVKSQLANAENMYVRVDGKKQLPQIKQRKPVVETPENLLHDLSLVAADCRLCGLARTRKKVVFGDGDPHAKIVFVGEAPGADEDEQGLPFVGRAGQLLTNIIAAMGLERKEVYICNIIKCRPPGNRNPLPEEIRSCEPYLKQQLRLISPQMICALGSFAAKTLLKTETAITLLRGRFHSYEGIPLMPTYHPAYLLRNPSAKKQVWDDVQLIMKEMEQRQL